MDKQYLIAHKCRGKPAFEIAELMKCPLCEDGIRENEFHCDECSGEGYWYITHYGHRAYPYWSQVLDDNIFVIPEMPTDCPEHFEASAAPKGQGSGTSGLDLLVKLGLSKPVEPMTRRSW